VGKIVFDEVLPIGDPDGVSMPSPVAVRQKGRGKIGS
jgi:hypothetical protein